METFNVVSKGSFPRQHPEAARRLLRALVKAEEYVDAHPRESQQIMAEFCGTDISQLAPIWHEYHFNVSLRQSLLLTLEDQARWAIKNGLTDRLDLPDFSDALYVDGLQSAKPDAVRLIR